MERSPQVQPRDRKCTVEHGLLQMREALEACGGVANQDELDLAFQKRYNTKFSGTWRRNHFGFKAIKRISELATFRLEFVASEGEKWWIFRFRNGVAASSRFQNAPVACTEFVARNKLSIELVRRILLKCKGSATEEELHEKFKQYFGVDFMEEKNDKKKKKKQFLMTGIDFKPPKLMISASKEKNDVWIFNLTDRNGFMFPTAVVRAKIISKQAEDGKWEFQLQDGDESIVPAPIAPDAAQHQFNKKNPEKKEMSLSEVVTTLVDLGGLVPFDVFLKELNDGPEKDMLQMNGIALLRKLDGFDEQIEAIQTKEFAFLQLKLQEHWKEIEDRFLKVLDFCNGCCTFATFRHSYHLFFGSHLHHVVFKEIISHFPSKMVSIVSRRDRSGSSRQFIKTLDSTVCEGRRRVHVALLKTGGLASLDRIRIAYQLIHKVSLMKDSKQFFGTDVEEELLEKLRCKWMFVRREEWGDELILRPDCYGFSENVTSAVFGMRDYPPRMSDEEMFKAQSTYVADRVEAALKELGGKGSRQQCAEIIQQSGLKNDLEFSDFVEKCPYFLFKKMIASKALICDEGIVLNTHESARRMLGCRQMLFALKKAGGRATVEELKECYENLHGTNMTEDWKKFFGTTDDMEVLLVLRNNRMLVIDTERGSELFLKPDCTGFHKEIPFQLNDEALFNAQCDYVADQLEGVLEELGGTASREECKQQLLKKKNKVDTSLANFIGRCPTALFEYMIKPKATMTPEGVITLNMGTMSLKGFAMNIVKGMSHVDIMKRSYANVVNRM